MRVFVTGATGFIGMAVTKELIGAGHQVIGLSRSTEKAPALAALGAEVVLGKIEDLDLLKTTAARADGVIHLAFNHDFSRFVQNCEDDRQVVAALGAALAGSGKPLLITSGTAMASTTPGQPAGEDSPLLNADVIPRVASEEAAAAAIAKGANISIIRLPQVHDTHKQGLVTHAIALFLDNGVCAYTGDGQNAWPAAHISDVARLYRLALEKAEPGAIYHAVAEEGVTFRDIVETIGKRLNLPVKSIAPEQAAAFFGWLAHFVAFDLRASSAKTQQSLGWHPSGPRMLTDLQNLQLDL